MKTKSTDEKKEPCFFLRADNGCGVLASTKCDGFKGDCKFYKTEKQYITEYNRAIDINRSKGNCKDCKYVFSPCCHISAAESGIGGAG